MRRPWRGLLGSLLFLASVLAGSAVAQETPKPAAKPESADCRGCHEEKLTQMDKTYHAGLEKGCYACHEGAEDHLKGQMEGAGTAGDGILRYQGAFDDVTFRQRTPTQVYLYLAVEALLAGRLPDPVETPAYGCSTVRYPHPSS